MESVDGQQGRDGSSQKRSPLDVLMSQIRRKRSDRKPLGRFLSWTSDRTGTTEDGEPEGKVTKEQNQDVGTKEVNEQHMGWGQVCVFLQKLGKKSDSRNLNLAHCELTATDLLELASLLKFLPQLEEVDASWNDLIGGSLTALTSHLPQVSGLKVLKLCSCRLDADDVAALGEALLCLPLLEKLDLSWNSEVGSSCLQGFLGQFPPSLAELHLVACQITAPGAAVLGGLVAPLPRLNLLDVSHNPQLARDVDDFRELVASLSIVTSLTALRLQACGLTPDCLGVLGESLSSLCSLRELDLSCNKHLSGGLNRLSPHLVHVEHLESLDLHLCCLTRADLEALILVLSNMRALKQLNVSSNKEVGQMVHPLVSFLPLTQIRQMPMNSCSLTEESFYALVLAVPYLHSVDVSWCKVVCGRSNFLLDALQPSTITELRLSSCNLTSEDLCHLAAASRRGVLSSLRLLDLSYNHSVSDEGWSALFAAGGLGSLEDLDLSLRPTTFAPCSLWLSSLLCALPRMPTLVRLAMQRWTAESQQRLQLEYSMKTRNIQLDWDITHAV